MNVVNGNGKQQYKYLTLLAMLFMTIKLTTILLIYKIIHLGPLSFTASTLVMPCWFFLGIIITETYGYPVMRHLIWMTIICQSLFAIVCTILIHVPSPDWINQAAYDQILGKLPRITMASSTAIMCGAFINSYATAKYKILSKGKRFWLRSLKASFIGELVFTVIAYLMEFVGIIPFQNVIKLMAISFAVKILLSPVLVIPVVLITKRLKQSEGIDIYDIGTNFSPFKLNLNEKVDAEVEKSNVVTFPKFENNRIIASCKEIK